MKMAVTSVIEGLNGNCRRTGTGAVPGGRNGLIEGAPASPEGALRGSVLEQPRTAATITSEATQAMGLGLQSTPGL